MEQTTIAPSLMDACEHELTTVAMNDNGTNVKSLCDLTGTEIWTNCRSWGRCTMCEGAL